MNANNGHLFSCTMKRMLMQHFPPVHELQLKYNIYQISSSSQTNSMYKLIMLVVPNSLHGTLASFVQSSCVVLSYMRTVKASGRGSISIQSKLHQKTCWGKNKDRSSAIICCSPMKQLLQHLFSLVALLIIDSSIQTPPKIALK